jgi:hypothetical protein
MYRVVKQRGEAIIAEPRGHDHPHRLEPQQEKGLTGKAIFQVLETV